MNVHISYKISKTPDLEKLINQQVEKLGRYLQVFGPELVHLKGSVEENSTVRVSDVVAESAAAVGTNGCAGRAVQQRSPPSKPASTIWPSRSRSTRNCCATSTSGRAVVARNATVGTVPFEDTVAAIKLEQISSADISNYVNVNLPRLQRFIQRELTASREPGPTRAPARSSVEDVVSEAIANALDEQHDKPERMKLEPWIHRLAIQAINHSGVRGPAAKAAFRWSARMASRTCAAATRPGCNSTSRTRSCSKKT